MAKRPKTLVLMVAYLELSMKTLSLALSSDWSCTSELDCASGLPRIAAPTSDSAHKRPIVRDDTEPELGSTST
jgi:hypothetical protein